MQKNVAPKNRHRADIVTALEERGWSLRALSIEVGLSPNILRNVLAIPYPKGERVIAAAIGAEPEETWPERYTDRNLKPVFPRRIANG